MKNGNIQGIAGRATLPEIHSLQLPSETQASTGATIQ
jgi:hypothetical protein